MGESRKVKISPLVIDKSDIDNNNTVTRNPDSDSSAKYQNIGQNGLTAKQKNKPSPPMTPNEQPNPNVSKARDITEPWLVGSKPRYRRQSSLV